MADTSLSLKSLLVPSKAVEVEYPGLEGFKIDVVFLSRETLIGIRKKSTKTTMKNRQPIEELNDDLFLQLYVNACIKGWKGLKLAYVNELAPVDLEGQDMESLLPYSQDNALYLMKSSSNFDSFISDTVGDLSNFTKNSTSA
ncbi:MAG: hypothetical protein BWY21_00548 [Parcubacteria group bacterium ADurb.Bin216]|nr:MAG: hypothetical protein BWY21_00548 [Parcubacteria group bacterium ADurb.Bin216]